VKGGAVLTLRRVICHHVALLRPLSTLAVSLGVFLAACSSPTRLTLPSSTSSPLAIGAPADITVSKCAQDPADTTQVIASGSIIDHTSSAADYSFTIDWYLGSMLVTKTSVSQTGVPPDSPLDWTTETGVAVPSAGPYSCKVTRVIRTPET
jgi:hypothetical protein